MPLMGGDTTEMNAVGKLRRHSGDYLVCRIIISQAKSRLKSDFPSPWIGAEVEGDLLEERLSRDWITLRQSDLGQETLNIRFFEGATLSTPLNELFPFGVAAHVEISLSEEQRDLRISRVKVVRPFQIGQRRFPAVLPAIDSGCDAKRVSVVWQLATSNRGLLQCPIEIVGQEVIASEFQMGLAIIGPDPQSAIGCFLCQVEVPLRRIGV